MLIESKYLINNLDRFKIMSLLTKNKNLKYHLFENYIHVNKIGELKIFSKISLHVE